MIIIKISFNSKDLKLFIKEIFGFYVVSFVFAGATIGVYYSDINFNSLTKLLKNINGIFPVKYLVVGVSLSIILAKLLFDYHNKKIHKESYIIEVKIFYKDKIAKVDALIDTGNSLSVPFTNNPVFIVEYEKIKELLPLVISDLFYSYENDDFYTFEKLLREIEKEVLIKLIPYKSIGNNKGVLFGFKPDFLLMNINGSSEVKKDNYYIGIYNGVLSHDLSFNGLLHYDTMRQEETVWMFGSTKSSYMSLRYLEN